MTAVVRLEAPATLERMTTVCIYDRLVHVSLLTNHPLLGSGTTAILAIARTISRKRIQFKSNVELVAFVSLVSSSFQTLVSYSP